MNRWIYILKIKELRNKLLSVIFLLVVFRLAASIPVPGVDVNKIEQFFNSNQFFGLLNVFSGGGMSNFSLVMLGVGPYITASIIMQLFTVIFPKLNTLYKEEGEEGRRIFNQYTRVLTVPLAIVQGASMITLLSKQGLLSNVSLYQSTLLVSIITAGTIFLMWLGELITDKNIGNGISLIIFAGIVSQLPASLSQFIINYNASNLPTYIGTLALAIASIFFVVIVTEGQRNIPVSYAKKSRGSETVSGINTYLPIKVNQAGVMPIIFSLSILLLPNIVGSFVTAQTKFPKLHSFGSALQQFSQNQFLYAGVYFVLVIAFTFFYTAITFEPKAIAENLQKQGGFISGFRPGTQTEKYLTYVSNRIMLVGAIFLGLIAVLPFLITGVTGNQSLAIGGTSLLIVVSVVLETMKQIDSQIIVRDYDSL